MTDCIFCKIAAGEIPSVTVYEDERVRAILDLAPGNPGHTLVLPKAHFDDSIGMPEDLLGHLMAVGSRIGQAQMEAMDYEGFHLLQNNKEAAGQSVFHFHLHVIPRRKGDGAMGLWKPGSPTPEELKTVGEQLKAAL